MQLAPGTWRLAGPVLLAAVVAAFVSPLWSVGAAILGLLILWFHRDPDRHPPASGIVAPADGRVSVLRREDSRVRVGVFMNVTDVHVNRAPSGGTLRERTHVPGANRPAFTKDSDRNERLHFAFDDVRVTLIAGWFARRIYPHVEPGEYVERGERIGHVSFGSRADVLLPERVSIDDVRVSKGDRVRAGETVLVAD
ncbi:Phosphatidylserine decarboxylase [Halanaeroarchaeum sp. HSR-CO]|uniref:protein sorting system archaetidylserine decarboxylase n=1 Tax=Halanaeroarchaeum sp. HSR-CO TaxID=2866382 RepID=UPI00217D33E0|nr:protein sorting system archaetidylserine decarboxylase [Halanaeroarchaeum sp. HSR-CO]UWG48998.1 Phosphatidylserine decarboxylase [Halanaeroarchaeum sp. HSR-CO]